jgi:hypothetical protein
MLIREKNGSLTINCKQGEATMSTRSFGMVGKTYKTAQEAFKEPDYYTAIQRPQQSEYSHLWCVLGVISVLTLIVFVFNRS